MHHETIDAVSRRRIVILFIATISAICTFPLLTSSIPISHDIPFHLARIQSIADGLRAGVFPVRLFDAQAFGFGYPTGMCYPDLLLYLPSLLVALGCGLWFAYTLFVLCVNVATAVIAYRAFSAVFRSRRIGLACCTLWTLSPYRLCDILLRASVGEYLSLMFVPLLVLGLWRLFLDERSAPGSGWLTLAIGATGIVLSHVLSVVLFMPPCLIALVPLILWRRKNGWLLGIAKAAGLSILLCVGFLLPFLSYYTGHDLGVKHFSNGCYGDSLEPAQLLEAFLPMKGWSGSITSALDNEMPMGAGWCLMLGLPAAALVLFVPFVRNEEYDRHRRWIALFSIGTIVTLFMTTFRFPWNYDGPVFGVIIQALSVIQFPWRLIGVASLMLVLILGSVASCTKPRARMVIAASLALCILECAVATSTFLANAHRFPLKELLASDHNIGNGEYLPTEITSDEVKTWLDGIPAPLERGTSREFETINPQRWRATVANDTDAEKVVRLPIQWHHQLVLQGDNPSDASIVYDGGFAGIKLAPHTSGTFEIAFVEPVAWRAVEVVSGAAGVGLVGVVLYTEHAKRRTAQKSDA